MLPECNAAAEILRVILAVALPEDRLLLPHASALHAHVVLSSLIAVLAVGLMVNISGEGQVVEPKEMIDSYTKKDLIY